MICHYPGLNAIFFSLLGEADSWRVKQIFNRLYHRLSAAISLLATRSRIAIWLRHPFGGLPITPRGYNRLKLCAIYVEYAQHLTIRGCELNGCCNGFFCNSKDDTTNELSADILIESCRIHDNGYPGNYGVHNIYTEAKGVTFQYNLIGWRTNQGPILRHRLQVQYDDRRARTWHGFLV